MCKCYIMIDTVYDIYMPNGRVKGVVALVGGLADPYEDRVRWNLSELKEIKSLVCEHNVWDVMYPPKGANIMTLKWVYTVKTNGELKSRLVCRGFKQIQGVDYHETFSPVAKLVTFRIILSLAAAYDLELGCNYFLECTDRRGCVGATSATPQSLAQPAA